MFGNVKNWINEKVPNMPNVGQIGTDLINKIKPTSDEAKPEGDLGETGEQQIQQQQQQTASPPPIPPKPSTSAEATEGAESADPNAEQQQQEGAGANPLQAIREKGAAVLDVGSQGAQKAVGAVSDIGSKLFSLGKNAASNVVDAGSKIKEVIEKKTILGEFSKENDKFVAEKKETQAKEEAGVAPWVGYNEEDKLKSQDSRNFLKAPPSGVDFFFDFKSMYPVAMATLEEDADLRDMRFKLVPKQINEENFWRNYFYRVSLVKQSFQLGQLNNEANPSKDTKESAEEKPSSPTKTNKPKESLNTSNNAPTTDLTSAQHEFVSDSYDQDAINDEELKKELKQLKLNNKKSDKDSPVATSSSAADVDIEDADWDKELPEELDSISAEELEKEINQMISGTDSNKK